MTTITETEFDPFASANDETIPEPKVFEQYGKLECNIWTCAFVSGGPKVVFDPNIHKPAQAHVAIDVFVQPLAEIDVKYPKSWEAHWVADDYKDKSWKQIALPSIHNAGITDIRVLPEKLPNGESNPQYKTLWVGVVRVPSGETYPAKDKDGNPTGEIKKKTTFKFLEFYDTEDACRAAYLANGGTASNIPAPVVNSNDAEMSTAYAFLKVIVTNAARGKNNFDEAKSAVETALSAYPTVAKFYTVDSPETLDLLGQVFPPF